MAEESPHKNAALQRARARSQTRNSSHRPADLLARKQQLLTLRGSKSAQFVATADSGFLTSPTTTSTTITTTTANTNNHTNNNNNSESETASEFEDLGICDMKSMQSSKSPLPQQQPQQQVQQPDAENASAEQLYALLAKKDKDLQFAAELGRSLLQRNEELSRATEKMADDYSAKLEVSSGL